MMENYQKNYEDLTQKFNDLSVGYLFEMAGYFAVRGDFDKKAEIYQLITQHCKATMSDLFAVATYACDQKRRKGSATAALAGLNELAIPKSTPVLFLAEYQHARAQCLLALQENEKATQVARSILALSGFAKLPADKRLYYLECLLGIKEKNRNFDEEYNKLLRRYEKAMDAMGIEHSRVIGSFLYFTACRYQEKKKYQTAAIFYLARHLIAPDPRSKVMAACKIIHCLSLLDLKISDSYNIYDEMKEYFIAHRHELQVVDKEIYYEYDSVCDTLGLTP